MEIIDEICTALIFAFFVLNSYDLPYVFIGFLFKPRRFPKTSKKRKYAFIIAARNEEKVVGLLIDSIHKQDYFDEPPVIFVVADNCCDKTAEVCRSRGAVVYERFDSSRARKGYALEFLFSRIDGDYGIGSFDGYFIFDADNLLSSDFVTEMNNAFVAGADIVTSYRNTKNFDTNLVSSAYGIHFFHNTVTRHRPRSILKLGTHLTGTGYLISSCLIKDGWRFTNLTEDDELTIMTSARGIKVEYCEAAEFYDEQPCDFKTAIRQRARWARGRLVAFGKHGGTALAAIFKRRRFTNYDLFFHYFPYGLFVWLVGIIYPLAGIIYDIFTPYSYDYTAMLMNIFVTLGLLYTRSLIVNTLIVIKERRHIRCSPGKKILYVLASPWFVMISVYIYLIALFADIKWTPIIHCDSRRIEDVMREETVVPLDTVPAEKKAGRFAGSM